MSGKFYKNTLNGTAGYEISAIAPIDSRTIIINESDLGGECFVDTEIVANYGKVSTWLETPCYVGMVVYVIETKEMWVLSESDNGQTPTKWLKIASTNSNIIPIKITGDDVED